MLFAVSCRCQISNCVKDTINVLANGGALDKSKKAAFTAAKRLRETEVSIYSACNYLRCRVT